MIRLLFAGSFDPVTYGHQEVITRASRICDELLVGVAINTEKRYWFSQADRIQMLQVATSKLPNIKVIGVDAMLAEKARALEVTALVRGARSATDFDAEVAMADINQELNYELDTILIPGGEFRHVSSSAVRAMAKSGATAPQLSKFVPEFVATRLVQRASTILMSDIARAF